MDDQEHLVYDNKEKVNMAASFLKEVCQINDSCTLDEKLMLSMVVNFIDNKNIKSSIALLKKLEKL